MRNIGIVISAFLILCSSALPAMARSDAEVDAQRMQRNKIQADINAKLSAGFQFMSNFENAPRLFGAAQRNGSR